jgi:hypothetical protein
MGPNRITSRAAHPGHPARDWRRETLLAAGFEANEATRLAADRGIDLHALLDLTDRGCPPALAVRILAPLDRDA